MFAVLKGFAPDNAGCDGLILWVRADSPRAIAFYEKVGFERDVGGPVQRDDGAPHLTMRRPL